MMYPNSVVMVAPAYAKPLLRLNMSFYRLAKIVYLTIHQGIRFAKIFTIGVVKISVKIFRVYVFKGKSLVAWRYGLDIISHGEKIGLGKRGLFIEPFGKMTAGEIPAAKLRIGETGDPHRHGGVIDNYFFVEYHLAIPLGTPVLIDNLHHIGTLFA